MERMEGTTLSTGLAKGVAVVVGYELQRTFVLAKVDERDSISRADVGLECERMDGALKRSQEDLNTFTSAASDTPSLSAAVELLSVHATMATEIASAVKKQISSSLVGVEDALDSVISGWVNRLQKLDSDYLREREIDVRDVGQRMMRHLIGVAPADDVEFPQEAIIVARELVPSDAIALANSGVVGIVTELGGTLGHTAIIARSLGIPAVSGIRNVTQRIASGATLLVDGDTGFVTAEPTDDQLVAFAGCVADAKRRSIHESKIASGPCQTLDGTEIALYGNVGLQGDIDQVLERGLAGVGLFRTEFIYMQSKDRPDVESQRFIYAEMAERLGDRPLVIRTFDLGGEKLPLFLSLDRQSGTSNTNLRGLRFSLGEQNLLRDQLTAIVHVAQTANVRILFPMVIGGHDFSQAIAIVNEVMHECGASKRPLIGAMIETPAALFCLEEILELADFITIGTNDLTQYLLAADRELSSAHENVTVMHPAVLRAIHQIVTSAQQWDCPVCVCGEEAGEPEFVEIFIGLGGRELSLSPSRANRMRAAIGGIDIAVAKLLARQALACRSAQDVRELFSQGGRSRVQNELRQSSPHLLASSP